jgi:structure-specific recognition protein 1
MFPAKTFGELSKYTSEQYKLLTEEEKAHWAAVATRDKERYIKEMERYVPPDGYDKNGVMIAMKQKGPRKYVRRDKDPNAPKRARGSYVFFTLDTRPRVLQEFPDMKFTDLGNVMGERWRRLDPESKKHYEALAKADLQRYQDEMDAFNASKADEQAASYNKDPSQHVYDSGYYQSPAREHPQPSHMSPQQQQQQQQQQRGEHDANHSYYYPNDYNGNHQQQAAAAAQHHDIAAYQQYQNEYYAHHQQQQRVYQASPTAQYHQMYAQQEMPHEMHEGVPHEREMQRETHAGIPHEQEGEEHGYHHAGFVPL